MSTRMQLISSSVGSEILNLFGMPVYQQGNVIDLGVMKLEVAEACSGLRYLFPLASFGYLAAYLLEDRLWKRAVLLLSVLPITILINAARIALIGVSVNVWGQEMATGVLHYSEGFVAFLLCGALLLGEIWLLLRIGGSRGRFRLDYFGPAKGRVLAESLSVTLPGIFALLILVAIGTLANVAITRIRVPAIHSDARRLDELIPLSLGGWYGTPLALEPDVLAILKLTDYFLAEYRSTTSAPPVALYLAYFATQSVGAASHSPANCIPAGGWKIIDSSVAKVRASAGRPARSVNRLRIRHGAEEQLVYYWFDEGGQTIASPWADKWALLKNQLLHGRSDGYLVRVTTPVLAGGDSEADERLSAFLGQFDGSFEF
jgi:exosortase D (VPLPA-CTERM-specific)